VKQIEPRAQVRAEPLTASFSRKLQPSIYGSELAGFLGLLALAIASVGMYGVFAYVVGQRTREIGVRMALGAQASQIVRLVLGSSARALVCGLGCGIGGAAAVVLASAAPARRATRVDPVRALRWE
jgi:ABC-type antimicrobial peptide transport system permease subunit